MIVEIIVMFPIQHRTYRDGINNLLVLLIGGIPIAMPTVLSVTLAIGSYRLSQQVHRLTDIAHFLDSYGMSKRFCCITHINATNWNQCIWFPRLSSLD